MHKFFIIARNVEGGAGAGAGEQPWHSGLDPAFQPQIAAKGWDKLPAADVPKTLAESYFHLEKLIGHEKAGNTVVLPGEKATDQEREAFYSKLGRPEKADGYDIKLPENADPAFANSMREIMHKAGLSKSQGDTLAAAYRQAEDAAAQQAAQQVAQRAEAEMTAMQSEMGADKYGAHMELYKRGAGELGIDQALGAKIEAAIGTRAFIDLCAKVGQRIGEAGGTPAGDGGKGGFGALTPEAAKAKVQRLSNDKEFQAKLLSPNLQVRGPALVEWEAAFKSANPSS